MLKFVESRVVFSEVPDEITLAISISNCPNHCKGCSEPYLADDIGTEITHHVLDKLICENKGISCVAFMGGDGDHESIAKFSDYIKHVYKLKVAFYSGQDELDLTLVPLLDYYKIGRFILPEGESTEWHKTRCGPICFPWTNQILFKRQGNTLIDITKEMQKQPINHLENYIVG